MVRLTGASIYSTPSANVPLGVAVVKVHGVVSDMVAESRVNNMMRNYPNRRHYKDGEKEMMASLMKISDECGLSHVRTFQLTVDPSQCNDKRNPSIVYAQCIVYLYHLNRYGRTEGAR
eukprot:299087-Pyramimonas_sp.AAC.1